MRENGLSSAYGGKRLKVHPGKPSEADAPNIAARGFQGRAPRTHVCSDLTYVRVGGGWSCVCLLVDLCNRETVGHSAGPRKDADLVRSAFATLDFPISDIEVLHTDRGSEFDNAKIDCLLDAFDVRRSPSKKGRPYDSAWTNRPTRCRRPSSRTASRSRTPASCRSSCRTTSTGTTTSESTRRWAT